jgi:hypothetical protein
MDSLAASRSALMQALIARSNEIARERRLAGALRQAASQHVGRDADSDDVFVLAVPAQRAPLVDVTVERRRRLRRHIAKLLRAPLAEGSKARPTAVPAAASTVVHSACAACQGRCCGYGAERAYLTEATIARVATSGDRPPAQRILRRYMARVPHQAVGGSCIFHGAQGCTLDRSMRSDTCNNHFCPALKNYLRHAPAPETRDVLVMAVHDDVLHDARLVHAETPP